MSLPGGCLLPEAGERVRCFAGIKTWKYETQFEPLIELKAHETAVQASHVPLLRATYMVPGEGVCDPTAPQHMRCNR